MSRITTLKMGYARIATMAAAIRAAADNDTIVLVRLAPDHSVVAYNAGFRPVELAVDAAEAIDQLMRGHRPDIDWSVGHDWNLSTGNLRRSPSVDDRGYAPETELLFGGSDPVFLPTATDLARNEAA